MDEILSDKFKAMFKKKTRLKSGGGRVRWILDQRDFFRTTVIERVMLKIHYSQRIWLHLTASDCL